MTGSTGRSRCLRMWVGLGAAVLTGLITGCTPSGAAEETSSPVPDEAAATGSGPAATDAPAGGEIPVPTVRVLTTDRKSTRLNSSHVAISYAVFCLKKKTIPT